MQLGVEDVDVEVLGFGAVCHRLLRKALKTSHPEFGRGMRIQRKEEEYDNRESSDKLTSRDNPHPALRYGKHVRFLLARRAHFHLDFTFVYEKAHLHLATVFSPFVALGWELDDAAAEEGQCHDLGILEVRTGDVACDDARRCERQICRAKLSVLSISEETSFRRPYLRGPSLLACHFEPLDPNLLQGPQ